MASSQLATNGRGAQEAVGIVGGGVSGLVTAKVLQSDGFDVTVFEKEREIGGVWASTRTYPDLRTNNTRELYEFSDLAYPADTDVFPTADQVRDYLNAYADRFGVRDLVRLRTEVLSVSRLASADTQAHRKFRLRTMDSGGSGAVTDNEFDYVVICNGVFSEPFVPDIEGADRFAGTLLHSSELTDTEQLNGKRTVVVGAGKSALDCAAVAAKHGSSCTLVFRSPRWMAPRYVLGIRYDWLFMNRFLELFYGYYRKGRFEAFLHGPLKPLIDLFWRIQTWIAIRAAGTPTQLVPDQPLPSGFENLGVGADFYDAVYSGRAVPKRAEIASFEDASKVLLTTGEKVEADIVIFATGWEQNLNFLDEDLRRHVRPDGKFTLYRHILPPDEQRLGFVGYASSLINTLTSEISAHWLSQHFRGELTLPSPTQMNQEITRMRRWAERKFPAASEGYFIGPFIAHHVDDLMRDMNLPTRRSNNPLTEYFGRLLPSRYRAVHKQRRRSRRIP
jgi:cation diffusion facilitator CzcD-associated flavoprotein CzcO